MATYAHIVGGLSNGQIVELTDLDIMALSRGERVEFGPAIPPRKVELEVHDGNDRAYLTPRPAAHYRLLNCEVKHLLDGTRSYRGFAIDDARGRFELPGTATMRDIERAVSDRLAEARLDGVELPYPAWMEDAAYDSLFNEAASGTDFFARQSLLFELALDGRISTDEYRGAMPTYSEIASICANVEQRVAERTGMFTDSLLYTAWHGEMYALGRHAARHIYGVITGDVVADNDLALAHICAKLTEPRKDYTPVYAHFRHLRSEYMKTYLEERTDAFKELEANAEIIARAPYIGSDLSTDIAFEEWRGLMRTLDEE